jgi:hypothetical protein
MRPDGTLEPSTAQRGPGRKIDEIYDLGKYTCPKCHDREIEEHCEGYCRDCYVGAPTEEEQRAIDIYYNVDKITPLIQPEPCKGSNSELAYMDLNRQITKKLHELGVRDIDFRTMAYKKQREKK